jgi:hypothetical protein
VAGWEVRIEGATETAHQFQDSTLKVPERLDATLEKGAGLVRDMARMIAQSKGDIYTGRGDHGDPSRAPGDLIRKISVRRAGESRFDVVEHSRTRTQRYPGGWPYPNRIEYEGGGRAFMRPAAEAMTPVITTMVDSMLDRLFAEEGF